ncbi:hypothetical protein [Palleronia rufa]|uniref:hypothetical protein n=1 Tax=Palleronia rufa TaxID=1530186 RepID=UPI00190F5703|nr:hypothetical protein [Palleronia rufa]
MPKCRRNRRTGIKRQVAEYHPGDTLHALGRRHELSRNPIRIGKAEAGVSNEDAAAARLLADREARIAALARRVGRQVLEIYKRRLHAPDHCRKRACIHDNRPVGLSIRRGRAPMGIARSSSRAAPDGRHADEAIVAEIRAIADGVEGHAAASMPNAVTAGSS